MATWTIANLERNLSDGGVTVAHWRVTESETVGDVTYTASSYGTCGFTPGIGRAKTRDSCAMLPRRSTNDIFAATS